MAHGVVLGGCGLLVGLGQSGGAAYIVRYTERLSGVLSLPRENLYDVSFRILIGLLRLNSQT